MPIENMRCPKCGSQSVEKGKNQEFHCITCEETFYFVTPKCGEVGAERYKL